MPIPYPSSSQPPRTVSSSSYPSLSSASSTASDDSQDTTAEEEAAMIQEEFEENMRQFETILSILVIPFFGRWYGRRFAYFAYERWQQTGWTRALLGLA